VKRLAPILGFALLAAVPAFAAQLTEEAVVMGEVEVTTIFCIRAPCPGPLVRLVNEGQPAVRVTGDLARVIAAKEAGKTIAVTGELSADGKELRAKSYLPFSELPQETAEQGTAGANVGRTSQTRPAGASQSTQAASSAGAGLKRE
jgi:hypothetical protein